MRAAGAPRRRGGAWSLAGTLLVIAAAALVVLFVVVPLLQLGRGGAPTASVSPTPVATPPPGGEVVVVPDLIGERTDRAIEAAREAGLVWTVHCAHDESLPEGIVDQEPPPETEVPRGSRFNLYSARISDCR